MSTPSKTFLTPEQYLEIERKAEYKSEYYNGEMFAMVGARSPHNLITTNVDQRAQPAASSASLSGVFERSACIGGANWIVYVSRHRCGLRGAAVPGRSTRHSAQSHPNRRSSLALNRRL